MSLIVTQVSGYWTPFETAGSMAGLGQVRFRVCVVALLGARLCECPSAHGVSFHEGVDLECVPEASGPQWLAGAA